MSKIIVASCPGKVCVVGGYAILDKENRGLVIATSARVRSSLKCEPDPSGDKRQISIYSKAFGEKYSFSYELNGTVHLHRDSPRNSFVEYAVRCSLLFIIRRLNTLSHNSSCVEKAFHVIPPRVLHVIIDTDSAFYSQNEAQQKVTMKSGIGSSACITTSLVAALLLHFYSTGPISLIRIFHDQSAQILRQLDSNVDEFVLKNDIHFVSQVSHNISQNKIGSGFDVCSAVFGCGMYSRYSLEPLVKCEFGEDGMPNESLIELCDDFLNQKRERKVLDFSFQPTVLVNLMADQRNPFLHLFIIRSEKSTSTVDMVSKFSEKKKLLGDLFPSLLCANEAFLAIWQRIVKNLSIEEAQPLLEEAQDTYRLIRSFLKEIGNIVDIPIEPDISTRILDVLTSIKGVVCAGCPGSGGYDAMFVLVNIYESKENIISLIESSLPEGLNCMEIGIDQQKGLFFNLVNILD